MHIEQIKAKPFTKNKTTNFSRFEGKHSLYKVLFDRSINSIILNFSNLNNRICFQDKQKY